MTRAYHSLGVGLIEQIAYSSQGIVRDLELHRKVVAAASNDNPFRTINCRRQVATYRHTQSFAYHLALYLRVEFGNTSYLNVIDCQFEARTAVTNQPALPIPASNRITFGSGHTHNRNHDFQRSPFDVLWGCRIKVVVDHRGTADVTFV